MNLHQTPSGILLMQNICLRIPKLGCKKIKKISVQSTHASHLTLAQRILAFSISNLMILSGIKKITKDS
jgi:NhaP-type Na+/H+ and K+/H+ antiporter